MFKSKLSSLIRTKIGGWVMLLAFLTSACAMIRGEKSGQDLSTSGPNVLNARVNPSTIELNRDLEPLGPAEVVAEVKDFASPIQDVRLRFVKIPAEVKMKHVRGTTWQATFTPALIKQLAIGNQTTTYQANVIARSADGKLASSLSPLTVAIKAPDISKNSS